LPDPENSAGFAGSIVIMIITMAALLLVFRWNKWL
jgi:Mg2+ and Co2+ transporter CorA